MKDFDPKFADFPDYILGITHEIWEGRGIETLNHYYAPDLVVRSPASVVIGNQTVIQATRATLDEFPDRQLLGEDVIWSGTPEEGMLSSHRIMSTATHTADGLYGKASGKQFQYRIIADCHAKANTIDDEWLIRDQGAIIRQMGVPSENYARDLLAREGGPEHCVKPLTPATDVAGPYKGRGNDNMWGATLAEVLNGLVDGSPDTVRSNYDRAAHCEYPGGQTAHGWQGAETFWTALRTAFPSATFQIDHQIGRDDPLMPPRAAVRWSLTGKHDGPGLFGAPTGASVYVLGITHAEFGSLGAAAPKLRREWTLFDETAIWKQILLQTGAV